MVRPVNPKNLRFRVVRVVRPPNPENLGFRVVRVVRPPSPKPRGLALKVAEQNLTLPRDGLQEVK